MRIGINTLFLVPGDVGGTEVYFREMLKSMVSGNTGDIFVLFTTKDNDGILRQYLPGHPGIEFVKLPFRAAVRPMRIVFEQVALPWFVWKNDLDVLWSPGYTAPLLCGCPQAVTIHDLQYKTHPDDLSFFERITLDFLVKNACRVCDRIITVSQFSRDEVVRFGFAPEPKVVAIHEGVDPAFGRVHDVHIDCLKGIPDEAPYILCVAHTYPHKQVHLLVEAFGSISNRIPHHLVLVGRARRGEDQVQRSLDNLSVTSRVHRMSNLSYSDLQVMYQRADLFVLPSLYEGFGLPVLEAMITGTPVIATHNASIPEVGGDFAIYAKGNSAEAIAGAIIEALSIDSSEMKVRIEKARVWSSSFSWSKSAKQTIQVLHGIVSLES